jgi:hypothetical protein
LKPAFTPFIDETGDDHGLGAGVCEEAPDDPMVEDAYVDVERKLLLRTPVAAKSELAILLMDMISKTLQTAMRRYMET